MFYLCTKTFKHMLKRIILLSTLLFITAGLLAQLDKVAFVYGFDYMPENERFTWSDQSDITLSDQSGWELGIPGVALSWSGKSGTTHTVESMPLRFSHELREEYFMLNDERFDVGKAKSSRLDSYAQYRFGIIDYIPGEAPFRLFLDISATLRAGWIAGSPLESYYFPYRELDISIAPGIVPGISLDFGERVFISLSIPLEPAEFEWSRLNQDNPQLPEDERTTNTFSIRPFYRWMGRIGAGIRL